jgi:hypothetical protein
MGKKANQKEFESLNKRVQIISEKMYQEVKNVLIGKLKCLIFSSLLGSNSLNLILGKIQELQTLLDTKANGVQFELLNHDKIGQEEYQWLNHKIGMWSRLQLENLERNLEEHKKYLEKKEKNTTVQNSSDGKVFD